MALAPIILFAYNRPKHTRFTLEQLKKNKLANESLLYIFIDGPKTNALQTDISAIREVKEIVRKEKWCKEVIIQEAQKNLGLAASVINGVSEVINQHGKVIVLEDDLLTDEYFLDYMNKALEMYETFDEVACISGYIYPVKKVLPTTFFIKGADCWGWATWKRAWDELERDGQKLLQHLETSQLTHDFDFFGTYPYTQMLKDRIAGKNSSWAILWYASAFLKNKLCLYPGYSLIKNIGNDGSGTHAGTITKFDTQLHHRAIEFNKIELKEDVLAKKHMAGYFKTLALKKSNWKQKVKALLPDKIKIGIKKGLQKVRQKPLVYGWSGNYKTWQEVENLSAGYNREEILRKVKAAVLKVKSGEAAFERDGVAFEKLIYSEALLHCFLKIARENNNTLRVIDFGGSLGSLYFQYRSLLPEINTTWKVVEQAHFVSCGNQEIAENGLSFFESIETAQEQSPSEVLLLSSVLAYLPDPYGFIQSVLKHRFSYILLYRTAFVEGNTERLTLQRVPPTIYEASYPAWFLNENKLLSILQSDYQIDSAFAGDIETELDLNGQRAYWKGILFKRK